jgi:hypothetical protein
VQRLSRLAGAFAAVQMRGAMTDELCWQERACCVQFELAVYQLVMVVYTI